MNDLKSKILEALEKKGPMSLEELLKEIEWTGDLKPLRRILAEMIRENIIVKEPNYERKKLVYKRKT
ncbi:MAG: hypothetical protein ACK4H7_02420 [Acidilobaceae archaeon]